MSACEGCGEDRWCQECGGCEHCPTLVARLRAALIAIDDRAVRHHNADEMRADIRALVAGALRGSGRDRSADT